VTVTAGSAPDTFATVPGDRHSEVARTLAEPVPRALSAFAAGGLASAARKRSGRAGQPATAAGTR
jgi:hypothetical protein